MLLAASVVGIGIELSRQRANIINTGQRLWNWILGRKQPTCETFLVMDELK